MAIPLRESRDNLSALGSAVPQDCSKSAFVQVLDAGNNEALGTLS
jgi:hypothetical protein